jgi:hypothetical protein
MKARGRLYLVASKVTWRRGDVETGGVQIRRRSALSGMYGSTGVYTHTAISSQNVDEENAQAKRACDHPRP